MAEVFENTVRSSLGIRKNIQTLSLKKFCCVCVWWGGSKLVQQIETIKETVFDFHRLNALTDRTCGVKTCKQNTFCIPNREFLGRLLNHNFREGDKRSFQVLKSTLVPSYYHRLNTLTDVPYSWRRLAPRSSWNISIHT